MPLVGIEANSHSGSGNYGVVDKPILQHSPQLISVMFLCERHASTAIAHRNLCTMSEIKVGAEWASMTVAEVEIPAIRL